MHKDANKIVYKNIYYMLMYAIDELRGVKPREIDKEEFKALNDLYASILNTSMIYVLNSGVLQEYKKFEASTNKPKGKIDIANSIKSINYQKGLIACSYFRLNIDNNLNRVIKLAIKILMEYNNDMTKENVSNLRLIRSFLNKVSDVSAKEINFRDIDTKHLGIEYKTAFYMARLIIEEFITKEDGSKRRIIEMEDKDRMSRIFEKFVRNYYIVNYRNRNIEISAKQFNARITAKTIYRKLITDITIRNKQKDKVLIIDTKWYKEILKGDNKISSDNQTQIRNYVYEYREHYGYVETYITGILLYAKTTIEIDIASIEKYHFPIGKAGFAQVCTKIIDLNQDLEAVEKKLDSIFNSYVT